MLRRKCFLFVYTAVQKFGISSVLFIFLKKFLMLIKAVSI